MNYTHPLIAVGFCFLLAASPSRAATNAWYASSGLLPDQVTPNWVLFDTATANPTLTGGELTLSTAANTETMFYRQSNNIAMPSNLTVEFRTRFVSRNTTLNYNSPMNIAFTTAPNIGNILYLAQDDLWLANGISVRGPSASVDTDGAFHTYRIEVAGTTAGSAVNVYYDGGVSPIISHTLINNSFLNGSFPRVLFGDATGGDSGVSKWEYLWHNGSSIQIGEVIPEPSTLSLLLAAGALLGRRRWE
jgi:hypothetical protein